MSQIEVQHITECYNLDQFKNKRIYQKEAQKDKANKQK